MKNRFFLIVVLASVIFVGEISGKLPEVVSKEQFIAPDAFWTFSAPKHKAPSIKEHKAYIQDVSFDTSYIHHSDPNDDRALRFLGTRKSFLQIPNENDTLSGTELGAWFFYINIDSDVGESTILEYEGQCPGGQGFMIRCINGYIHVSYTTSTGSYETGSCPVKLTPGVWTYIGVSWHHREPLVYVNYNGVALYKVIVHNLKNGEWFEAHGNVKVGGSFTQSGYPFKGRIACLWFQRGFYIKKNKTPKDFCDPALRTGGIIEDVTDVAKVSASACDVMVSDVLVQVVQSCTSFKQHIHVATATNTTTGFVLSTTTVEDLSDCAKICLNTATCMSFSSNATYDSGGTCILTNSTSTPPTNDVSFTFYKL